MNLPETVSLVMRSYNEAWALGDTLAGVFDQDYAGRIELIVIDSGSTDGSVEIIERYNPAHFRQISSSEYIPGKVLNWGLETASNDWVVFLNSDATPANKQWLTELLKAGVETVNIGAAFSRQIPREDCQAVFAHDYDRCFGPDRESRDWDHFFSMVSCLAYKPVWEKYKIREDLQYAEDDEWTRRLKREGYQVIYAEKSIAIHSHNYTLAQSYKRARGDMKAATQAGSVEPNSTSLPRGVLLGALRDGLRDFSWCRAQNRLKEWPHALATRVAMRLGRRTGNREAAPAPSK